MIEALVLATQMVAAPMPPQDWSALQPLPYAREIDGDPGLSGFVAAEVKAGRCAAASPATNGWVLKVDVAVLLGPDGQPRRAVPRAIACPSVEQYAAGLVSSLARGKAAVAMVQPDAWYRASLTFSWPA
ncbi:hypothetical protein LPN01_03860 [Sphingomonas sp. A2-49]|uniref:hypothetical protein n=1 Tax=Sphingomonas sp. A2-49 TaxID=1391375 RepID=UPI0021D2032B|nr:hypothetical protein [Sphingomonas sp. A2-49]MCU6453207.1 hypothetical protein [Sphingomonas sp. A2-49]